MDAIEFLCKEHDKVRKALNDIAHGNHNDATKRKMFDALSRDLICHETLEQQIWYPHFKGNHQLGDEVKHLISEEKNAEKLLERLESIKISPTWDAHFLKFKRDVEHHAAEEEQKLFPMIKKTLNSETLKKIGEEMIAFKKNYQES